MSGAPGLATVAGRSGRWLVEERSGTASALHRPWPPGDDMWLPRIAVCRVLGPDTLVLGSTQGRQWGAGPARSVAAGAVVPGGEAGAPGGGEAVAPADGDGAGTETGGEPRAVRPGPLAVVRRRSGGGAVLVRPDGQVWVDVWVPRGDLLWDDDVVAAAGWVGAAWAAALGDVGVAGAVVHRGRLRPPPALLADVCFAGLGPGEVLAGVPARKVVGVSQHRSRAGSRFLTMAPVRWQPATIAGALCAARLVAPEAEAAIGSAAVAVAAGLADVGAGTSAAAVARAVVARLTASG